MKQPLTLLLLTALACGSAAADPLETAAAHAQLYGQIAEPAPIQPGQWVPALPEESATLWVDGVTYHVFDGTFYRPVGRGFVAVETPQRALLDRIPLGHAVVDVEGTRYYVVGEHFFVRDEAHGGYRFVAVPSAQVESATVQRVVYRARALPKTPATPVDPQETARRPIPEIDAARAGNTG